MILKTVWIFQTVTNYSFLPVQNKTFNFAWVPLLNPIHVPWIYRISGTE